MVKSPNYPNFITNILKFIRLSHFVSIVYFYSKVFICVLMDSLEDLSIGTFSEDIPEFIIFDTSFFGLEFKLSKNMRR